jgi:hypothetical protein
MIAAHVNNISQIKKKCQTDSFFPAILILAIRTSKFGGHYMPVILRERLTVTSVA